MNLSLVKGGEPCLPRSQPCLSQPCSAAGLELVRGTPWELWGLLGQLPHCPVQCWGGRKPLPRGDISISLCGSEVVETLVADGEDREP